MSADEPAMSAIQAARFYLNGDYLGGGRAYRFRSNYHDEIREAFMAGAAWQAAQDRALVAKTIADTGEASKYHVGTVAKVDVATGTITIVANEERRKGSRSVP